MPVRAPSLFLVLVGTLLGCKACDRAVSALSEAGTSPPYWAHGCVTKDARLLAVAGDGWGAVELDSGKFLVRAEQGLTFAVHCGDTTAKVYAVNKTIDLPSGTVGPEDDAWRGGTPLWTGSDGTVARWRQARDKRGRRDRLPVLEVTPRGGPERRIEMGPSLFGSIGSVRSGGPSSWVVLPHGELADGGVALVAGWEPDAARYDWAFFRLDPATGRVSQLGPPRASTATRNLGEDFAGAQLSHDRRSHLLTFSDDSSVEIALYDPARVEPTREVVLGPGSAPRASLSVRADRVLVRTEDEGAARQTLRVVDLESKRETWKREVPLLSFAGFLPDGSVVYFTSTRRIFRVNADGTDRWRVE